MTEEETIRTALQRTLGAHARVGEDGSVAVSRIDLQPERPIASFTVHFRFHRGALEAVEFDVVRRASIPDGRCTYVYPWHAGGSEGRCIGVAVSGTNFCPGHSSGVEE